MIYLELFLGFLKVGFFAFGGGYAAVPLIRETVLGYGWLDDGRLSDLIAVSESTPGPIMVNMATYIGATQGGFLGAVIATLAAVLPAFVIVLVLMEVMKTAAKNKGVEAAVNGLKPCIVGIILATGIYMAGRNILPQAVIDFKALVLTAVLAIIYFGSKKVWKEGISPIVLILISGTAGILLYGIGV